MPEKYGASMNNLGVLNSPVYYPSQSKKRCSSFINRAKRNLSNSHSRTTVSFEETLIESPTKETRPASSSSAKGTTTTNLLGKSSKRRQSLSMSASFFRRQLLSTASSSERESFDSVDIAIGGSGSNLRSAKKTISVRRSRLPSLHRSCESTDSSHSSSNASNSEQLAALKSHYRIMMLGSPSVGKTSIVRQFLYDRFNAESQPTVCDFMYRGEFEIGSRSIVFDIQDVSGEYVYEFPSMRDVSIASADAFIIVFALDDPKSWDEVSVLRDMILSRAKDSAVPIVVVGNKSDLTDSKQKSIIPMGESIEAIVTFDWENGYVESSAKESRNVKKIFKELLQQAKTKYDFTTAVDPAVHQPMVVNPTRLQLMDDSLMKRRQSLPAVPAGLVMNNNNHHHHRTASPAPTTSSVKMFLPTLMSKMHLQQQQAPQQQDSTTSGDVVDHAVKNNVGRRRSSMAAFRRDSCKIS